MNDEIKPEQGELYPSEVIDEQKRQFLLRTTGVLGGIGAVCALTPFVSSWLPSAKAQAAGAPVEVDISKIEPGQQVTVEWRGKPVWIIRRTPEMLKHLNGHNDDLRDPDSLVDQQPEYAQNKFRSINPEYLVLVGICTHLGCSPKYTPNERELRPDWPGGFFCPCHGSTFDLAGRVFKGVPAPINLEVPPYRFVNKHLIIIGEDEKDGQA
ncbi:ubiquinol-cytochrome c reductase iron-sulfur subunit [Legionella quinlivanii]|uniref:Ubiquinol-cytochrome c reductase iron-sulfur subunit n=1 Tax=Legionella quinlivanii TaxID=45073 RepID=A0A0W0Y181_9GAMM|nr:MULTISPECIES: ubiquinol-cytochrome c reductase iron-sulfur subunit [Legionella]MCE3043611.1 ubiquinol-cytochrome c reductase iron-sulfur subunit [Legionella sp. 16cNR16C]KTD50402.1 ubiquinol-cytochrome c reductase iron-sulfur subunit [Legionella quinlivanii]RAP35658.1 ubiquinol-cytochrome c reductase iron-sulfur subunit [Legionella quinlivanii]SEF41207.1 ubiquinol-cytochrome c reductase iron-sulfur subunit [Legionella quinlivanii DSM 21216]STY12002.1 ubiquinol-cytochrome c reductase, iron-s